MGVQKKSILATTALMGVILLTGSVFSVEDKGQVSAAKPSRYEQLSLQNQGFAERAKKAGIDNAVQTDIVAPSNKALLNSDSNNSFVGRTVKQVEEMKGFVREADLKDGAYYQKKELITYEQFINTYPSFDLDPTISKDRLVWVTKTHYPNGFQHKRGYIKNAILTKFYDAETGELYGYSLSSLDKGGNGIRKNGDASKK